MKQLVTQKWARLGLLASSLGCSACGGGSTGATSTSTTPSIPTPGCNVTQIESELSTQLAQLNTDVNFSFAVERDDGRRYVYNRGNSTMSTSYESASTSKMLSALIILRQVERGYLKLDDKPQDWIPNWPVAANSPLRSMTLASLLSFTSGLTEESICINVGIANFESCVLSIATANASNAMQPGSEFYYSSSHLQVAGLMAIKARGVTSWQDLFSEFQQQTALFKTATYDLPSMANPRLAGGMHWTGTEYLDFLSTLKAGKLLSADMMQQYLMDRTANAKLAYSPAAVLGETWHYGLGYWHECQSPSFNCTAGSRISSPGAYGAYPYWDRNRSYVGIVARQGALGTFPKGLDLERAVRPKVETWLACKS